MGSPAYCYAASGTSAPSPSQARSSAWPGSSGSLTRSSPRTSSGGIADSRLSRPNSRSTAPREQDSFRLRSVVRGIRGCRRSVLTHRDAGLALARRASPLRSLALEVGAQKGPLPVLARGRLVVATDDSGSRAKCRDGNDPALHVPRVDRLVVVPLVHDGRLDREPARLGGVDQRQRERSLGVPSPSPRSKRAEGP
jgi:hypothetical protein